MTPHEPLNGGGNQSGNDMAESRVDSKGRIVIPEGVRRALGLTEGSKVRVSVGEGGGSIVVKPSVTPEEFIRLNEGFLKPGSRVQAADPLKLKEIWSRP